MPQIARAAQLEFLRDRERADDQPSRQEIFVGGGRAQLVTGEFAEMGHTSVHMLAIGPKPVRLDNYSIYSMGCGWIGG